MPAAAQAPSPSPPDTRASAANPAGRIVEGASSALLRRIRQPAVELAIWKRRLAPDLARWLDSLPEENLPDGRVLAQAADLIPALTALLDAAGTPDGGMRTAFLADVVGLAKLYMDITGSRLVDIRLDAIHHDACWKFHRDCVAARLLTTYRGPGTQWVRPADDAAALAGQKSYRGPVQQFPRHAVGLFKGSCAPPASGIVHRSPAIAGTGATRLLLCLNPPSPASPEPWGNGRTIPHVD